MGQHYTPTLTTETNKLFGTFYAFDFNETLKLMEHSWIGNPLVEAVVEYLSIEPLRLSWVGNYADDVIDKDDKTLLSVYETAMIKDRKISKKWDKKTRLTTGYLVNHSKKQVLDLKRYIEESTTPDGWCVNPLSLLTAIGNGLGGGDYCGLNEEAVGYWANDVIGYEEELPTGYNQFFVCFKEAEA